MVEPREVRLRTPKGANKGLYIYVRRRPNYVECWRKGSKKQHSYALRWVGGSWHCDCQARKVCSHILGCPWKGKGSAKKHHAVGRDDLLTKAAKAAKVRLPNGRIVNAFDYFWK